MIIILGTGQIVGCADSGLDMLHNFFYDPNRPPPFNTVDMTHRKVVSYVGYGDIDSIFDEHGTAVAGLIAGESIDSLIEEHNGVAEEAKIAFFDIHNRGNAVS